jgi:hypothetical protein
MAKKRYYYSTEEKVTTTRKGYIEMEMDFTQVYDCFEEVADKIGSVTSMRLLLYLLKNMGDSNDIRIDTPLLRKYNDHRKSRNQEDIPLSTFHYCVKELTKAGALTRYAKGCYYLNPHFFWKDTPEKRREFLQDESNENRFVANQDKIIHLPNNS